MQQPLRLGPCARLRTRRVPARTRLVQRRNVAVVLERRVGAVPQQPAHGLCLAGARGRGERGLPAHAAACIHIDALQRPSCGKTLPKG